MHTHAYMHTHTHTCTNTHTHTHTRFSCLTETMELTLYASFLCRGANTHTHTYIHVHIMNTHTHTHTFFCKGANIHTQIRIRKCSKTDTWTCTITHVVTREEYCLTKGGASHWRKYGAKDTCVCECVYVRKYQHGPCIMKFLQQACEDQARYVFECMFDRHICMMLTTYTTTT